MNIDVSKIYICADQITYSTFIHIVKHDANRNHHSVVVVYLLFWIFIG